jgi:predicted RNA-binding protein with PUA-like domain
MSMVSLKNSGLWLMKTEPGTFSYDDLLKSPKKTTSWEGVRNYQARNFMRDDFKLGHQVFIYHSSCDEPGIIGIAAVVREAHPDLSALNPKSPYFDPKSEALGKSRWCMVDIQAVRRFKNPVSLAEIKAQKKLGDMLVIRRGMRLSIQPVAKKHWEIILEMGQ